MKTAHLDEFGFRENMGLALYEAMKECRKQGINRLVIGKGTYELDPDFCAQKYLSISNHGFNGPKKIAVLIEDMEGFEIDFSGSTLLCHGIMTPIAIVNSRNITLRNLRLKNTALQMMQASVVAHGDGWIDTEPLEDGSLWQIRAGGLYGLCPGVTLAHSVLNIEYNGQTGEIEPGTADNTLDVPADALTFEQLNNGCVRIYGGKRKPPIGNVLVFASSRRLGCGIFCEGSENILAEDVDLCSCYGMGMLAQMCRDITLRRFNTLREDGRVYSICADATHFVACQGTVLVEDCRFEGQFDDALNIHGIYTRILDKGDDWLLVREMHDEAKGIRIYEAGDEVAVLDPKSLIPYETRRIKEAEYINDSLIRIYVDGNTENIRVGDDVENLTHNAALIFRRNTVRDNRARGMLIATREKVLIEENHFHTAGGAILFESDGEYWFESGATRDVVIRRNHFDHCKHGGWCNAVIECCPRRTVEAGKYYHGRIAIEENIFDLCTPDAAWMDNAKEIIFAGNQFSAQVQIKLDNVRTAAVQDGVNLKGNRAI